GVGDLAETGRCSPRLVRLRQRPGWYPAQPGVDRPGREALRGGPRPAPPSRRVTAQGSGRQSRAPNLSRVPGQPLDQPASSGRGLGDAAGVAEAERELAKLRASDPAMAPLDRRLAALRQGGPPPEAEAERLRLARRAYDTALYATAARLW